jgi:uncharacterized protein
MNRRRRVGRWLAIVFVVLAALSIALFIQRRGRVTTLRIATGQKGGTFLPLGEELAANINRERGKTMKASAVESSGSPFSVDLLEKKEVELALVSNNTQKGEHVRLIAPLYPETLQVVVRAGIATPKDLAGKRVAIGPAGSGTETIATQVLDHFGIRQKITALNLSAMEAATQIEKGEIDAVFVVAGLRAPIVERLLARDDLALLSLGAPDKVGGSLDGIHIDAPFLLASVIPERTYGDKPAEPVGTMSVKALLVARDDLEDDVVYDLAQSLFSNKLRLSSKEKLLSHLSEKFDPADSPYPLHPGADRYLRRNQPSVFEQNTDFASLLVTLCAILWSGISAFRAWRRRSQKSRIEHYFADVAELSKKVHAAKDKEELATLLKTVNDTEARALSELAAERLEPNDAFRVLQEALRTLEEDLLRLRKAA